MKQFEDFWNNDKRKKRSYFLTTAAILASAITIFVGGKIGYTKYQASTSRHQGNETILDSRGGEVKGATTSTTTTPEDTGTVTNKSNFNTNASNYQSQPTPNYTSTHPNISYPNIYYSPDTSDNNSSAYQDPAPSTPTDDRDKIAECIAQNRERNNILEPVKQQIYDLQIYYWDIPDIMTEKLQGTGTTQSYLDRLIQVEREKTQNEINKLKTQYSQLLSQYPACSY